jgi:hypothetical protein
MNDEQMRPILKTWFRARSVRPADVPGGVAQVVARLPRTRQRDRWWLLGVLDRPAPIPTTDRRRPAGGFTMFSALKLVVAAAVVALFGGLLLMGIVAAPHRDEVAPAAVTVSPSPMSTETLLSAMVVEEVEPGVLRVVHDGVRDLALVATPEDGFEDDGRIVAGLDGSVWVFTPELSFRLGEAPQIEAPDWGLGPGEAEFRIGPDGRVWVIVDGGEGSNDLVAIAYGSDGDEDARFSDGRALPDGQERDFFAIEILPDGTMLGVWPDRSGAASGSTAVTIGALTDGWVEDLVIEQPEEEWSRRLELREDDFWLQRRFWDLATNDDEVWLADPTGALHRRTESGWEVVEPPFPPSQIDLGPEGTLWIQAGDYHAPTEGATNEEVLSLMLARLDSEQWETWDRDDGIPPVGPVAWPYSFPLEGVHAVAPDGSIWLAALDHMAQRECSGIVSFDGMVWTRYLDGLCVHDADITPDGAVWLRAGEVSYDGEPGPHAKHHVAPVGTYVITPAAAGATE